VVLKYFSNFECYFVYSCLWCRYILITLAIRLLLIYIIPDLLHKVDDSGMSVLVAKLAIRYHLNDFEMKDDRLLVRFPHENFFSNSKTFLPLFREKHPYIQAIQNLAHVITHRINHPHLLPDLVFWNTKYGRRFQEAADIVHKQAEKVITCIFLTLVV